MTPSSSDCELVGAYATQGSEAAFRALVARHVDLVYATAFRQIGDSGIAEEITQNVFVVLAKKAPRLGGVETLAGWLHRTTIYEAKARVRTELRRKQREETAATLTEVANEGVSPLAPLIPLLDEALLNLREPDRLVLVLRFLEDRSLREVGTALGVDEDAARKRVSRALDRLSEFFRQRGIAVPVGLSCATLLTSSAQAAPAGLAIFSANAGIVAGGSVSGFKSILFHLMALSKTQTAILCLLVVSAPLFWQRQVQARIELEQSKLDTQLTEVTRRAEQLEDEGRRVYATAQSTQRDIQEAERRLALANAQSSGRAPAPVYEWNEDSSVIRVPKEYLKKVSLAAFKDRRGQLSEEIKETLQLTEVETWRVQTAVDQFRADYYQSLTKEIRLVKPTVAELGQHAPDDIRVFEFPKSDTLEKLRTPFFAELETILGPERFPLFLHALEKWMPVDNEYSGMDTEMMIFNFARREYFLKPWSGAMRIEWGVHPIDYAGNKMSSGMLWNEIPEHFRPHLQDWIDLLKTPPVFMTKPAQ